MDIKEANFIASSKISWFKEETSPVEMALEVTLSFAFFLSCLPNWNLHYIHPVYWIPRFKEQNHQDHQTKSFGRIEFGQPNLGRYEWVRLPNFESYCFGVHYLSIVEVHAFSRLFCSYENARLLVCSSTERCLWLGGKAEYNTAYAGGRGQGRGGHPSRMTRLVFRWQDYRWICPLLENSFILLSAFSIIKN